jgi:hypothetical protein
MQALPKDDIQVPVYPGLSVHSLKPTHARTLKDRAHDALDS